MKFEIGEVAIIRNWDDRPELAGRECTIINVDDLISAEAYLVDIDGFGSRDERGRPMSAYAFDLRKKKPPQELSTWEEVQKLTNWNPTGVEA